MPPKREKNLFTLENELLMVDLIDQRPILWDDTNESYKRSDLKGAVWQNIAETMGPGFTAEMVSKRWKSMRETFVDNWNRVEESRKRSSRNGADDGYRPKWKLYSKLQFLIKTCAQSESDSNLACQPSGSRTESEARKSVEFTDRQCIQPLGVFSNDNFNKYPMIPETSDLLSSSCESARPLSAPPRSHVPVVQLQYRTGPASAPSAVHIRTSNPSKDSAHLFAKRETTKRKATSDFGETLKVVKSMGNEPATPMPDSVDHFCAFVASRLREMDSDTRKRCEDALLSTMMSFS